MAVIELDPFQEIVSVSFPTGDPDTLEDFEDGENFWLRSSNCDTAGQVLSANTTTVFDDAGSCTCGPNFSLAGWRTCTIIRFPLSYAQSWPACVVGQSSGAQARNIWPDEPDGWPSEPQPFSDLRDGQCNAPLIVGGADVGFGYLVEIKTCGPCTTIYSGCKDCNCPSCG